MNKEKPIKKDCMYCKSKDIKREGYIKHKGELPIYYYSEKCLNCGALLYSKNTPNPNIKECV